MSNSLADALKGRFARKPQPSTQRLLSCPGSVLYVLWLPLMRCARGRKGLLHARRK
jgi:hypothetical protein